MGKQEREIADVSDWRAGDKITLEYTLTGKDGGLLAGALVVRYVNGEPGSVIRGADRCVVTRRIEPLPTEPGTVIAIGSWWFVKLEPYEDEPFVHSWELLPPRNEHSRLSMERVGVRAQCVYSDEWVRTEAAQEGEYRIVSQPNGHAETVVA